MAKRTFFRFFLLVCGASALMLPVVGCNDDGRDNLNSLLSGEYGVIDYSSVPWSGFTIITFDGQGGGTFERIYSSDSEEASGRFTYTVDPEGMFHSTVNGNPVYGVVSPDGSSFTMVHTAGSLGVTAGIKETQ